jgi:hypothetical protein
MATKPRHRPRDPIMLGKLIGDILTGQVLDRVDDGKSEAAAELGRKGGTARAANLSKKKRREIAKKGAAARWRDKK